MSNYVLPKYSTRLFTDIYSDVSNFLIDYHDNGIPASITDDSASTLFYLLYAKYGNNPIANGDEYQFKLKVFSIIFTSGPTWERRLDIQEKLRTLSDSDLLLGAKAIYNNAVNPGDAPGTQTLDELTYINAQNTTNYKKSKMEAYAQLLDLLDADVTTEFINKFKVCFKTFVSNERPLIYVEDEEIE